MVESVLGVGWKIEEFFNLIMYMETEANNERLSVAEVFGMRVEEV